jgi:hypothetical protein
LVNTLFRFHEKGRFGKIPTGFSLVVLFPSFSLCSDENGIMKMAGFQNGEACHIIIYMLNCS